MAKSQNGRIPTCALRIEHREGFDGKLPALQFIRTAQEEMIGEPQYAHGGHG